MAYVVQRKLRVYLTIYDELPLPLRHESRNAAVSGYALASQPTLTLYKIYSECIVPSLWCWGAAVFGRDASQLLAPSILSTGGSDAPYVLHT